MSQVTRCPHCQTCFRVVDDQLRVGGGWVRCGRCARVFDTSGRIWFEPPSDAATAMPIELIEPAPSQDAAEPLEAAAPDDESRTVLALRDFAASRWLDDMDADGGDDAPGAAREPTWDPDVPEPDDGADDRVDASLAEPGTAADDAHDEPAPAVPDAVDTVSQEREPMATVPERLLRSEAPIDADEVPCAAAKVSPPVPVTASSMPSARAAAEPGFVRAARRGTFWRRPAVRAVLALVVCALGALLVLQVLVQERDLLAARYPATRAWLQSLCAPVGCVVQAPRRIADVVIEASSFIKEREGDAAYVLEVGLKNRAAYEIATPALELTLVDASDDVLVRRVLPPRDLAAPAVLAAQALWTGNMRLRVTQDAARVAGYRVLVFYP
ncbi:MAG: zinc-ribbon domain-containing protein [Burkholderiales bacterium]|nr:zinc-ribbon domain-containing protein [Burkholderiales bacterium]